MKEIKTITELTCPLCNKKQIAQMPTDACQFFYKCQHCKQTFRPKHGDCCVFCSYGKDKCPIKVTEKLGLSS